MFVRYLLPDDKEFQDETLRLGSLRPDLDYGAHENEVGVPEAPLQGGPGLYYLAVSSHSYLHKSMGTSLT